MPQGPDWQNPVAAPIFLCYCIKRYGVIMSIKLAILKSGEQVIADIKEYVDDTQRVISLLFSNPYIVRFLTPELLMEGVVETAETTVSHKVSFSPWIVMSEDKSMTVPVDWVVTIVEPIDWVKKSYEEKMNQSLEGVSTEPDSVQPNMFQHVESLEDLSLYDPSSSESGELVNLWEESMSPINIESSEVIVEARDGEQ